MSGTATLEQPAIEDTLFGEARVVDERAHAERGFCFCICGCRTGSEKLQSNRNTTVDLAVSMPPP